MFCHLFSALAVVGVIEFVVVVIAVVVVVVMVVVVIIVDDGAISKTLIKGEILALISFDFHFHRLRNFHPKRKKSVGFPDPAEHPLEPHFNIPSHFYISGFKMLFRVRLVSNRTSVFLFGLFFTF